MRETLFFKIGCLVLGLFNTNKLQKCKDLISRLLLIVLVKGGDIINLSCCPPPLWRPNVGKVLIYLRIDFLFDRLFEQW
jgi:hypothetical protein